MSSWYTPNGDTIVCDWCGAHYGHQYADHENCPQCGAPEFGNFDPNEGVDEDLEIELTAAGYKAVYDSYD